jgi:hypothetical protein
VQQGWEYIDPSAAAQGGFAAFLHEGHMKKLGRSVIYTSLATDAKKPAARGSMGFEAFAPGAWGLG